MGGLPGRPDQGRGGEGRRGKLLICLRWHIEWGPKEKHIRKLLDADRPLPEGYLNKPRLMAGLEFLWKAFWELTTERPLGWGVEGRIPGSKITEFGKENGFFGDDLEWFRGVIREMDAEYLGIRNPSQDDLIAEVKLSDAKAVKAMLRKHAKPKVQASPAGAESPGHDGDD